MRQGTSPRILFFNLRSWHADTVLMAILARALMARGAHASFLVCGGGLPMCNAANLQARLVPPCHSCAYGSARSTTHFGCLSTGERSTSQMTRCEPLPR